MNNEVVSESDEGVKSEMNWVNDSVNLLRKVNSSFPLSGSSSTILQWLYVLGGNASVCNAIRKRGSLNNACRIFGIS